MGIEGGERRAFPLRGRRGREATPAGAPGRAGQAGPSPTPSARAPAPSLLPLRRASRSGLGPAAPLQPRAAAGARDSPAWLCLPSCPSPPPLRGSGAPSPAGVPSGLGLWERSTARACPRRAGLAAVGGLARGATRKLPAQVCVPGKKRLPLTMHKGATAPAEP